ncbi:endoribonuclease XendoU [Ostertagia ostertagi]
MSKKLRDADENKASRGQIHVNFQGHTTTRDQSDNAAGRLFIKVDESLLEKPSYKQRRVKRPRFSLRYSNQSPGKCSTSFFIEKDTHSLRVPIVFRYWIAQLWFVHYSRARGKADTSGFEHVFMGEEKNRADHVCTIGLRFYTLEKNATENFDYKGFVIKRGVEIDGCPLAITSFDIVQNNKVFIGSIFPTAGPLTEQCRRLSGRV